MLPGRLSRGLAVVGLASAAAWLGCGGGADVVAPAVGDLEITTQTSGPEPDADGYAVSVDGGAAQPIGLNATLRQGSLDVGVHTVELRGLAPNCVTAGAARLEVTVAAGTVAAAPFAVTCAATTGSIQVTTTAGVPADPDGYVLLLDGVEAQPIATSATLTLAGVAPGPHTVALGGVADGCHADGDDPRSVAVVAGQTVLVAIGVTCTPPSPGAGRVTVTTATSGADQDADGYSVTLDGGTARPVTDAAGVTFEGLEPGSHAVLLGGVASNCAVQGQNPRSVAVTAGQTAATGFVVRCTATTGSLTVSITGLPAGASAAVIVSGPGGFSQPVAGTGTLTGLAPGGYTIAAAQVTSGGTTYTPSPASRSVNVAATATATASVTYTAAAAPSLDLRIDGWYLSQSVQTPAGDVPLVGNRDGYLRVFVLANQANSARPTVRVRLYRNGALATTFLIPAPGGSVPTSRDESRLASSWNVKLPRNFVVPGIAVLADVDPDNLVPEKDESDNAFPASGAPQAEVVRTVPVLGVRFVPVRQSNGLEGDVSDANRSQFLDLTRRMHPTAGTDGDVHAVYTTSGALQPDDGNHAWGNLLGEIDALRLAEGTGRTYFGVVRIGYASGLAGLAFIGLPTAIGYDDPTDRGRVTAHELGHTWGRLHSPCGSPPDVDPDYPYADGRIGVYGLDMQNELLKPPSSPDIMGYCASGVWVSDYTYRGVLDSLAVAAAPTVAAAAMPAQRCLLVWGSIVGGRPVLEPAFEVTTRPSLPRAAGPYAVEGRAADGSRSFGFSFDAAPVADDPRGSRRFAFAVPLGAGVRLESLRLTGPAGEAASRRPAAPAAAARVGEPMAARRVPGGVVLRWDASAHPMVMVRDPETGQVLSFARGGETQIETTKAELDVIASDMVGSEAGRVVAR
jgi:hypothetical protein